MKTESPIGLGNMEVVDDIDKSNLDREGGMESLMERAQEKIGRESLIR